MIRSMTGFGRGQAQTRQGAILVEIRTLNHKFLEITTKLPNGLALFDDRVKALVKSKIKRGKAYFNLIHDTSQDIGGSIFIDEKLAGNYCRKLKNLKSKLGLEGAIRIADIISFPGVINYRIVEKDRAKTWPFMKEAIEKALLALVDDREKEGGFLYKDLIARVRTIKKALRVIKKNSTSNVQQYKKRLTQRIKEISGNHPVDKGRLEIEVALFAKNSDITEELTRLNNHVINFNRTIKKYGEVGKKLDFIAQELHREINTLGSKSSGFNISRDVIEVKTEIEKIREQLKNIE
jgi:uncharacterized protein (TIGR00255 family)